MFWPAKTRSQRQKLQNNCEYPEIPFFFEIRKRNVLVFAKDKNTAPRSNRVRPGGSQNLDYNKKFDVFVDIFGRPSAGNGVDMSVA